MQNGWMEKSLCLAFLCLPAVLVMGGGQSGTASVLDRVQKESDPELGELIRIAIVNRKANEKDTPEIVRKVTQSYAQIKLLDQQVEQVARKIKAMAGPSEMQSELLLAEAELESKRTIELANLREIMGVTPLHAFGQQPTSALNTWMHLSVLNERVYVLDSVKPFFASWIEDRWKSAGLFSVKETLDCVRERLRDRKNLPIRIDVLHEAALSTAAEDLRVKIAALVKEANAQTDADVRTVAATWTIAHRTPFFVRDGKIITCYPKPVRTPAGGPVRLSTGVVAPNDLEQHILWRLLFPGNVPLKFPLEYDEASAELAKQVADTIKAVAQRLGVSELVEVVGTLVEPVPMAGFLGRWQTGENADFQTIDIQPTGACLLTRGAGAESGKAGAAVSCPWILATKEIFLDSDMHAVYRGRVNAEGNLIVEKGDFWPSGSWHGGVPPTIYERAK